MKYDKPPLTFEEQAEKLINRGLQCNKEDLIVKLESVSYYRLYNYLYPFRNADDTFRKGTSFEKIWRRYTFDRQLRLIVLDSLERVEIALKTDVSYYHAHRYGSFAYLEKNTVPNLNQNTHANFLSRIKDEISRSTEPFVKDFFREYGDSHEFLPVFRLTEVISFGTLLTFFRGLDSKGKKIIAKKYGLHAPVLESWLLALNTIRNICAHHSRLFNRTFGTRPVYPEKEHLPQWYDPFKIETEKAFAILSILHYLLKIISPQSAWKCRLNTLMDDYSDIPVQIMGFPENWKEHAIWK